MQVFEGERIGRQPIQKKGNALDPEDNLPTGNYFFVEAPAHDRQPGLLFICFHFSELCCVAIDMKAFTRAGLAANCREMVETFCAGFSQRHQRDQTGRCRICLTDLSNTAILRHFENCPLASDSPAELLGKEMSDSLKSQGVQLPSKGSFAELYSELSKIIHNCSMMADGEYCIFFSLCDA